MASHVEALDKGLFTGVPRPMMPPGSLSVARNARYKIGSPALLQAPGRVELATAYAPVRSMAQLRWDPGTRESTTTESLNQLLYFNGAAWSVKNLFDDPTDPGWSVKRDLVDSSGATFSVPPQPALEVAQINSAYVMAMGGTPYIIERNAVADGPKTGTNYQYVRQLGMGLMGKSYIAASNFKPRFNPTSTGSVYFPQGYIHFWFTWYDSVNDVEGALGDSAALASQIFITSTTYTDIEIGINKYVLEHPDTYPSNADSIRIYRSVTAEAERAGGGSGADTPTLIGWPLGFRIREVSIATVKATAPKLIGGTQCYELTDYGPNSASTDDIDEAYVVGLPIYRGGWVDSGTGTPVPYSLDGPPPEFSTCTIFEECLVTNDLKKLNRIWWSNPGDPDHFGTFAYMDFDTDDQDEVIKVLGLGNVLMVYLRNSTWRVEYLPTPSDPLFSRGRVRDLIDSTKGIVSSKAACVFTLPGRGPMHAFVHATGIYATNGDVVVPLTNHVNWVDMIGSPEQIFSNSWLVNNPQEQRLEFYTREHGWYLQYDGAHLQENNGELVPAVTGPMDRWGGIEAAISILTSTGLTRILTASSTKGLYYEGFGTTDAAGGWPVPLQAQTRDFYLTGPLTHFRLSKVLSNILIGGGGAKLTLAGWAGDAEGEVFAFIDNLEQSKANHVISVNYLLTDYMRLNYYGPESGGASHGINFVALEYMPMDETEIG